MLSRVEDKLQGRFTQYIPLARRFTIKNRILAVGHIILSVFFLLQQDIGIQRCSLGDSFEGKKVEKDVSY